ncbi:unnamed protein product [Cyprideis torosa]|uniref:Terminase n=1 Tax=Cyprideis torosa TaxID=163714 RepID=A0A7R8ZX28_9CRUS|nr:unnamed protein product [Cyprideis torosa]CAG0906419.1 unnamed protein product [Cyprideis torosa]
MAGMIDAQNKREQAFALYRLGIYSAQEICEQTGTNYNTFMSWKRRGGWDELPGLKRAQLTLDAELCRLYEKPEKTDRDIKLIQVLGEEQRKNAITEKKLESYGGGYQANDADFNPKLRKRGRKPNKVKNHLEPEQVEALEADFLAGCEKYGHQLVWYKAKTHRIRNILKSRQIGATYHFAHEAAVDAFKTGDNQIFLSASRAQAEIFRAYIVAFVNSVTGVELKGNPIILSNGAELHFLSTSSQSAQGYHGHVYIDEYFWIRDFEKLRKVASGMASQKKWRQTYISTPSTLSHPAYTYWSGEHFNKGRPKAHHITLDISHKALQKGRLDPDGQWRQVITIFDAERQGYDLFDVEQLKIEYSPDEFRQLFECVFIDDAASVFKFETLKRAAIDSLAKWPDYDPEAERPYGDKPVWLGYDPSRTTDAASCVVVAPPDQPGGKFRILEKYSWHGMTFEYQAKQIENLTERFNVKEIGIDVTGMGDGVFERVQGFFRRAKAIHYSPATKAELVTKGIDVFENKRIEYDAGWTDLMKAFLTIYATSTENGTVTYKAKRTAETGHADVAKPEAVSGGIAGLLGYLDSFWNGEYYDTPLSLDGLVNARTVMPWHESAMDVKRQILTSTVEITRPDMIRLSDVENAIEDFLWSGNYYLLREYALSGRLLRLSHQPALYVRRRKRPDEYCWLKNGIINSKYPRGRIIHVKRYDPRQEVYGMPMYLSAMNHAFLNKSSVVFRRKYIDNGGHMGYILYLSSKTIEDETVEDIEDAMYDTTGDVGNLLIHDPDGSDGDLKLIKLSEITNKDDFFNLQNLTRDGVAAIHRVPPQLMGVMPANVGGFGSPVEAVQVFARNEIVPLQTNVLNPINEAVGFELLRFKDYRIAGENAE